MPLTLLSCAPTDIPSLVRLSAAAFSTPTPTNVFPDTPAVNAFRTARAHHSFKNDPFAVYLKIVDDQLPPEEQMIAYAKWARPHSKEEERASGYVDLLIGKALPEECDRRLIWEGEEVKARKVEETMGEKRFYYLQVLATHPAHSGRGCAGRLVKWGMRRAEEEGVECYVEAQDSSKPIFVKYGWRDVGELVLRDVKRGTLFVYTPAKDNKSRDPEL